MFSFGPNLKLKFWPKPKLNNILALKKRNKMFLSQFQFRFISIELGPLSIRVPFDPVNGVGYFCLCFGAQSTTATVWPTVEPILRMRT